MARFRMIGLAALVLADPRLLAGAGAESEMAVPMTNELRPGFLIVAGKPRSQPERRNESLSPEREVALEVDSQVACVYVLEPSSVSVSSGSGNGSFSVTANPLTCSWTASESSSWISLLGSTSGTGSGTVSYSYDANSGSSSRNGTIYAGGRSFTITQAGGPSGCNNAAAPSLSSPANGSANVFYSSGLTHSWNAGAYDVTYNLEHYLGAGCSNMLQNYQWLSSPNYTIAGGAFSPATIYSWRVSPFNSCGSQGTSSSCYSYITVTGSTCSTAAAPTLSSPSNNASNVSFSSGLTHSWNPGANDLTYNLNHYSGTGCSNLIQAYNGLSSPSYTISSGAFAAGSTYSWQVTPLNSCGNVGNASSCYSYTVTGGGTACTSAPPAPSLSSPSNGATSVPTTNVAFSWGVAGTGSNVATSYGLSLWEGACNANLMARFDPIYSVSYTVGQVDANKTFFWNVTATNNCGTSSPSNCYQFTTLIGDPPCSWSAPSAFGLVYPSNGALNVANSGTTFSWDSSQCATTYDLKVYSGAGCSGGLAKLLSDVTNTYATLDTPLAQGTQYSWLVMAKNSLNGRSTQTSCATFTTEGARTGDPTAAYSVLSGGQAVSGTELTTGVSYVFDGRASSAYTGTSLTSYSWSWGDGSAAGSGSTSTHSFSALGQVSVTLTVTQSDGKTDSETRIFTIKQGSTSSSPIGYLIPAAAHAPGENGTTWQTDVRIFNPSEEPLLVSVQFRKSSADNSGEPLLPLPPIFPGALLTLSDVVFNVFGSNPAAGALYFSIDSPNSTKNPVIHSNTYNVPSGSSSGGTYGQFIPGIPVYGSNGAARGLSPAADSPAILEGLRISADRSSGFRTNIGLANLEASVALATIEVWSAAGSRLASNTFSISPFGQAQRPVDASSFPSLSLPVESGYLRVVPSAGSRIYAYASVIDNRSGDGSFVSSNHETERSVFIAGAAAATGIAGTRWGTSLFLVNPTETAMTLKAVYTPKGLDGAFNTVTRRLDLPARGATIQDDIVATLFGLDATSGQLTIGPYEVNSTSFPIISGRTYNNSSTGTFGQSIPAVTSASTIGAQRTDAAIYLPGLSKTSAFRTNVGIYNQSADQSGVVRLTLLDEDGRVLAEYDLSVDPGANMQLNDIFAAVGLSGSNYMGATLLVTSRDAKGAISAYASVVDNRTGDPMFIPGAVR